MSKLQELVNKLVGVVISYRQTQKPHLAEADTKNILAMPLADLIATLHQLTETMTYRDRKPLMQFFIWAIEQVKPLVDKSEPLSKRDKNTIKTILVHLLTINATLLQRTQSPPHLLVTYGETTEEMPGFIRGVLKSYTYCNSGQVIQMALFQPQAFAELTESSDFQEVISQWISDHQKPLLNIFYMKQEISALKEQLIEISSIFEKIRMDLEAENTMLKAELLAAQQTIAQLQQQIYDLSQEKANLTKTSSHDMLLNGSVVERKTGDLLDDNYRKSPRGIPGFAGINFWASPLLLNTIPRRAAELNEDNAIKKSF